MTSTEQAELRARAKRFDDESGGVRGFCERDLTPEHHFVNLEWHPVAPGGAYD